MDIFSVNINRYVPLTITDGPNVFRFLISYLGKSENKPQFALFWPDYSPEALGKNPKYRIQVWHWEDNISKVSDIDEIIDATQCIAYVPFRFEANMYNEFVPIGGWTQNFNSNDNPASTECDTWYYVSINPWVGDASGHLDVNYVGSQNGFTIPDTFNLKFDVNDMPNQITISAEQDGKALSIIDLWNNIRGLYNSDMPSDDPAYKVIKLKVKAYIADSRNIYAGYESDYDGTSETIKLPVIDLQHPDGWTLFPTYDENDQVSNIDKDTWIEDMKIFAWLEFYHTDEESQEDINLIGFRTDLAPVTQQMWCFWWGGSTIEQINIPAMSNFPRVINKTIQQVTNISTQQNSKAGIVQPVFVRVRDLGQIIVHPAVTENICINLDAYKSSVDKFMIQIENATFAEIGRNVSGVVFRVVGNQLRNRIGEGTYYILDQNSDLVTTGKYQYEQ